MNYSSSSKFYISQTNYNVCSLKWNFPTDYTRTAYFTLVMAREMTFSFATHWFDDWWCPWINGVLKVEVNGDR